ncbi:hypothetical protein INR49_009512 [Caranx melampygus]|nr:hypothetical protein INR49_009512 [Caranx melampygus]
MHAGKYRGAAGITGPEDKRLSGEQPHLTGTELWRNSCDNVSKMLRAMWLRGDPAELNERGEEEAQEDGDEEEGEEDERRGGGEEEVVEEEVEVERGASCPHEDQLRKQAEKSERGSESRRESRVSETISVSDGEEDVGCPSQWNVEQVFSYINSLPGNDEIDGQALLLLTEDHLVSTMNLKLGPALKLCAHINSLKDT